MPGVLNLASGLLMDKSGYPTANGHM